MRLSMNVQKKLTRLGIGKIEELDKKSINYLAHYIANVLTKTFPFLEEQYNEILARILNCKMYYAKISNELAKVDYIYEDNSIYIDENINIFDSNKQLIHEIIHYLQVTKKNNGKIKQMGLCNFGDFAITGLGINEAAVQYISAKTVHNELQYFQIYGINIKTISPRIYPLLTNLMEQLVYLVGENVVVQSTIRPNSEFDDAFYNTFEEKGSHIIKNFDRILEMKNKLHESNEEEKEELERTLAELYIETQNMMISKYYEQIVPRLTKIEEIDFYIEKFLNHQKIIGIEEKNKFNMNSFYDEFKEEIMKKFDKQLMKISKERGKNTLAIYNNVFGRFFKKIISYFSL